MALLPFSGGYLRQSGKAHRTPKFSHAVWVFAGLRAPGAAPTALRQVGTLSGRAPQPATPGRNPTAAPGVTRVSPEGRAPLTGHLMSGGHTQAPVSQWQPSQPEAEPEHLHGGAPQALESAAPGLCCGPTVAQPVQAAAVTVAPALRLSCGRRSTQPLPEDRASHDTRPRQSPGRKAPWCGHSPPQRQPLFLIPRCSQVCPTAVFSEQLRPIVPRVGSSHSPVYRESDPLCITAGRSMQPAE